ncbi:MAG: hypothetical protein V9G21_05120 [Methylotenera sp.]
MQQNISLNEIGHSKKASQKNAFFNLGIQAVFLRCQYFFDCVADIMDGGVWQARTA